MPVNLCWNGGKPLGNYNYRRKGEQCRAILELIRMNSQLASGKVPLSSACLEWRLWVDHRAGSGQRIPSELPKSVNMYDVDVGPASPQALVE